MAQARPRQPADARGAAAIQVHTQPYPHEGAFILRPLYGRSAGAGQRLANRWHCRQMLIALFTKWFYENNSHLRIS